MRIVDTRVLTVLRLGTAICPRADVPAGALALFMLQGVQPSRLVDKARPDRPYDFVMATLLKEQTIKPRTHSLLQALLQPTPHDRRSRLELLNLDMLHSAPR